MASFTIGAPQPWPASPSSSSSKSYNYRFDCSSLGVCSLSCPEFCILPPPPPIFDSISGGDDGNDGSSSSQISPLMAALIAVLAAAFLLLFYFTVISKLCRRNRRRNPRFHDSDNTDPLSSRVDSLIHDPTRPDTNTTGLDDAFIRQITVFKYRREDKLIDGTECAICLNEFNEEETLRLMPNCEHGFHIPCIDTWLKSHSNCPLCRSTMNPVPPVRSSNPGGVNVNVSIAALRVERSNDVVLVIPELDNRVQVVEAAAQGEVGNGGDLEERESKFESNNINTNNNITQSNNIINNNTRNNINLC